MKNKRIERAVVGDSHLLAQLAKKTFVESHGHSASPEDIQAYIDSQYTQEELQSELQDPKNIYHFLYYGEKVAGFSKIILNSGHEDIPLPNITKLERIYFLKEFYGLKLGHTLFQYLREFSKAKGQAGMWLYVWKENQRAIDFYTKQGFQIIGSYDFRISANHTNPNYRMVYLY